MRPVLEYQGKRLVPLIAASVATGGFISPAEAAAMVADPERYCDAEQDAIVSAWRVTEDGAFVPLPHSGFAALQKSIKSGSRTVDNILLDAEALEAIMVHIRSDFAARRVGTAELHLATWQPNAVLPAKMAERLKRALPSRVTRPANNRAAKLRQLELIRAAAEQYAMDAAALGIDLDFKNLPGTKANTLRILKHIDPRIARSDWTFEKYCEKDLPWRWRQGGRLEDAPLLAHYGLT